MLRKRQEGTPFEDLQESDWQRASAALSRGEWGPFSIAADLQNDYLTDDEAHELVLAWLNQEQ